MSAQVIQSITLPPMKRQRSASTAFTDDMFKCGEVFVTNLADKWTFYCSHCQLATTDIGVFVCHIRLQHMNDETTTTLAQETPRNSTPITIASSLQNVAVLTPAPPATSIPIENLLPSEIATITASDHDGTEQMHTEIIKEEPNVSVNQSICSQVSKIVDISSLTQPEGNNETPAAINENTTTAEEIDQEFVAETTQKEVNEPIIHIVYQNEETSEKYIDDIGTDDSLTEDVSNDYLPTSSRKQPASGSNVKIVPRRKPHPSRELLPHKCPRCNLGFKSKQGVHFHIMKIHDKNLHKQLPYKCKVCNRGFKSMQGLKYHNINHDEERKEYKCSICPGKFYKLNTFITHVLTHESETRFPCQVCGKVYGTNKERVKHWEKHAKDKPFGCTICYRRFPRQQYLTHHLKSHNLYQCHFCPDEFTSRETQHIPYVCPNCEQLPDIKQKVEHLRTLSNKSHVFESDEEY